MGLLFVVKLCEGFLMNFYKKRNRGNCSKLTLIALPFIVK